MNTVEMIAARTMDLLAQKRAILRAGGTVFWTRPLRDRVILVFDPAQVVISKIDEQFAHELSTLLHGRRVVRTNSRGLYLQVGYTIPPHVTLDEQPLDLSAQPAPDALPIGVTARGPLWVGLQEGDSFLVGGVRGFGKSGLLHGFIQALLHGGRVEVWAWDGKDNAEYLRYYGRPRFHLIPMRGLTDGLQEIQQEVTRRMHTLTRSGHANIVTYNAAHPEAPIPPIALVIDEAAEVEDQPNLVRLVKVYRAAGVHPIFATNDPSKASVVAKSNLGTRISLPVVSYQDSLTILGHSGAHKLPKTRGRGLIAWGGRLIEFQAFRVEYPPVSAEGVEWLERNQRQGADSLESDRDEKAARIRAMIAEGMTDAQIVRSVWGVTGGGNYYRLREKVSAIRTSSSSETGISGVFSEEVTQLEEEEEGAQKP